MEAIAVIGGASAVLNIAVEFGKIGERLYRLVETLCHARKEVKDISKEVLSYSKILRMLDETLDSAQNTELIIGRASAQIQLVQELIDQSRPLLKDFRRLRQKLKPLREDRSTHIFSRTIARFQWSRNKSSTVYLRRELESHKTTLNLLIGTILLGEKVAEYKRFEKKGESIPKKLMMKIKVLRQELTLEKEECRRAKAEVKQLRHQQSDAVHTPTSAEHFTRTVLKLATRQLEVVTKQREQRGSIISSGEQRSPEQSSLSSNSRVHGNTLGHFGDTEAGLEIINIGQRLSSQVATQEPSPPATMQEPISLASTQSRRPAGSVPTALFGHSPEHQRYQLRSPIVGPVIHDDGDHIHELNRQWRTRHSSSESVSGSSGYISSDGGGENNF